MSKAKMILLMLKLAGAFIFLVIFFHNCSGSNFEARKKADELSLSGVAELLSKDEIRAAAIQSAFPLPFGGNGHSTSWDGRLLIYTPEAGGSWNVVVFRPERVQAQQGKSVNFGGALGGTGAFSSKIGLLTNFRENENGTPKDFSRDSIGSKSIFMQLNALSLVPASGVPDVTNPFKSDENGNSTPTGQYETYDLYLYTQHYGNPAWGVQNSRILAISDTYGDRVFGRMQMKVVVQNPKTENAVPVRTILVKDFEVIKTSSGSAIRGIEPTITVDGKLMAFNSNSVAGNGDELFYIYNSNPTALNSWTEPKRITLMNSESEAFKAQYALARKPILSATGEAYSPGESLLGAYPWLSFEGSEITYMAAHAHHPTSPARRTGFSVLGRWTGNKVRHIDGSFNKDTNGTKTVRLFTSALGSTSSIWNPMKEVKSPQLPFLFESPSYFMISLNTVEFSELGFRDFVDGRYEVSLPMNPTLKKHTNPGLGGEFDFNQTADLSQNNLNGSLLGGAAFPMETSNGIQDSVEQIGFRGQAIKFPASGSVVVQNHNVFRETNFGTTFEILVKPISDLTAAVENSYLFLINKPGSMSLILEKNRQLNGRITINGKEFSTGFVGSPLGLNEWNHVATTHEPSLGLFRIFVNGQKITELKVDQGLMSASTSTLIIGPGDQNKISKTDFLLHLDEFKFSSVARSSVELADSAGIPYAQRNRSLASLLPSSFTSNDLRLPSEIKLDADKVQLGFLLFTDPRLSANNRISCSSCHSENNGFADPVDFSVGVSGQKLVRHSPVVFNRLFGSTQMWDGRFTSLEQQSAGPVTHPAEMGMQSYQALVDKLKLNSSYVKAFQTVYGSEIKPEHIGNALASYQSSLLSGTSRYDSYFSEGRTTALSLDEMKGKDLFFGKAKCAACHSGPNFTDELYHNTGLFPADTDKGRGEISRRPSESRFFKTPTLRNLSSSAPYMHNGSLQTLEQVVLLYNAGGISDSLRDSEIKPLSLNPNEITQLVSFLGTLNSEIKPIISFNMALKSVEEAYPTSSVPPPPPAPVCTANTSTTSGCTQPTNGQSRKTCNSTGTAYGACTISCNTGFVVQNGQCVAQPPAPVCTANSSTTSGCTQPTNGQSKRTCNSTGTAYGACMISCNTGFELKNGQCVALPPSGPRVDFFSILTSDLSRPMSNSDFVENLYRAVLGRGSDSTGFADNKAKLDSNAVTRENTRIGFMKSDEFINLLFKTDNRAWVKNLYKAALRRESDLDGENFWVNSLNNGTHSRLTAVNGLLTSLEYISITKKDNIEDGSSLSPVCTANTSTTSGCTQPTNGQSRKTCNSTGTGYGACTISCNTGFVVQNGQCVAQPPPALRVAFFSILTSEISKPMSNADFVENLYRALLGRASDSAGFLDWKGQLDSNTRTREAVRIGVMGSNEFTNTLYKNDNRQWVKNLYKAVLRRESDLAGEDFWVKSLSEGTHSRSAVLNNFLNLSEYKNTTKKD